METIKKVNIFNRILLMIACIVVFVILYLFALNGRYLHTENSVIIDKWKKEAIYPGTKELPFVQNGVESKF